MEVIQTAIEGLVIIEPKIFKDARGYFFESFSQREFDEKVRKINFVQDNESMSGYGVMRGLHFQWPPFTQSKLVPRGFAHGFAVLSKTAVFQYKCDNFYTPEADSGISLQDESLGIDWQIPITHAILSEKDTKHLCLKDFDSPFDYRVNLYPEFT